MNLQHIATSTALVFVLSGCSGQKIENCWSAETKKSATSIVHQIVQEQIAGLIKTTTGTPATNEKKADIAARAKVELTNFHAQNINAAEQLTCGAMAHFSYTKSNNETISGETFMEFSVSRGENGNEVLVAKAPIIMMVNTAE